MWKKRGDAGLSLIMYALFELAIIAMFMAAILVKVNAAVKDQTYYERFLARDVALTTDSLHAAEGDFNFYYAYSTPKESHIDIFLTPNKAVVSHPDQRSESEEKKIKFLFGYNYFINVSDSSSLENASNSMSSDQIYSRYFSINKNEENISISDKIPGDIELK